VHLHKLVSKESAYITFPKDQLLAHPTSRGICETWDFDFHAVSQLNSAAKLASEPE